MKFTCDPLFFSFKGLVTYRTLQVNSRSYYEKFRKAYHTSMFFGENYCSNKNRSSHKEYLLKPWYDALGMEFMNTWQFFHFIFLIQESKAYRTLLLQSWNTSYTPWKIQLARGLLSTIHQSWTGDHIRHLTFKFSFFFLNYLNFWFKVYYALCRRLIQTVDHLWINKWQIQFCRYFSILLCCACYCKLLYFRQYQFSSNDEKRQFRQDINSSFQDYQNIIKFVTGWICVWHTWQICLFVCLWYNYSN